MDEDKFLNQIADERLSDGSKPIRMNLLDEAVEVLKRVKEGKESTKSLEQIKKERGID